MPTPERARSKATPSKRRRIKRSPAPAVGVSIHADFLDGARTHIGRLWDVSAMGACLWFPARQFSGKAAPQPGHTGNVVIHHPSDPNAMTIPARLAWMDTLPRASYAGLEFLSPRDFSNSFLRLLIQG